jgi:hypothetical protein
MTMPVERPPRTSSRSLWTEDWDAVIEQCKADPGEWAYVLHNRPRSVVTNINHQKSIPPFVTKEGRLRASMRNGHMDDDGKRRGDVYFRWEPIKKGRK